MELEWSMGNGVMHIVSAFVKLPGKVYVVDFVVTHHP